MMIIVFLTLNIVIIFFVGPRYVDYSQECYSNLSDPYPYFGTYTGYFKVGNQVAEEIKFPGAEFFKLSIHVLNRNFITLKKVVRQSPFGCWPDTVPGILETNIY